MTAHRLDLGTLDLANVDGGDPDEAFWFETLADGFSLGSSEAALVIQSSLMRDGDAEENQREGNRTVTFTVTVRGPDLAALADGERALRLETYRRNELSWTPPDGFGATTVFTVLASWMNLTTPPGDLPELRRGYKERAYEVTLRCEPHGRSATPETATFTTAGASATTVDDCSTTTNWSASKGDPITTATDGSESVIALPEANALIYSGPLPTANYFALDLASPHSVTSVPGATLLVKEPVTGRAYFRYWYATSDISGSSITFNIDIAGASAYVANLVESDQLPGVLAAEVSGSVRSVGSVLLSRASGLAARELQWAMVYADPILAEGFSPSAAATWQYGLEGTYVVYVGATSGGSAGQVVEVTLDGQTATTRLDATTAALPFRPIGELQLGGYRTGRARGNAVTTAPAVTVNGAAQTPSVRLFRKHDDASLTYVAPGAGVYDIEIASPSLDLPLGGLFAGGVRLASFAKAPSPDFPVTTPPVAMLWVDGYNNTTHPITVEWSGYPRWHTYAGK